MKQKYIKKQQTMIYSAYIKKENKNMDCYGKVVYHFETAILNNNHIDMDGEEWLSQFGCYIQESLLPCNKIRLDCLSMYSDQFCIELFCNKEQICRIKLNVENNGTITIGSCTYNKKDFSMLHYILEEYFGKWNYKILEKTAHNCGIDPCSENNSIQVDYYTDFNKIEERTETLNGKMIDIFNTYVSYNDTFKYINGKYMRFANKNVEKLFSIYLSLYKGNFFTDNAVKRGCLID